VLPVLREEGEVNMRVLYWVAGGAGIAVIGAGIWFLLELRRAMVQIDQANRDGDW
jgi:hypothetical protein